MINVLHLSMARSWRGGEQQIAYLATELKSLDCRQFLGCVSGGEFEKWAVERGFEVAPFRKSLLYQYFLGRQVVKFCRANRIDVIHTHDAHSHSVAIAAAVMGNEVPVVVSRRVDFPIGRSFASKYKYNHPAVSSILCVSNTIKSVMQADINDPRKLRTVYSGIDMERFAGVEPAPLRREFQIPEGNFIVGNVAALAPHKDYFTFVDTAEILLRENFPATFLIVGAGPLEEEIRSTIRARNLERSILMTGFRKDVPQVLRALDLFLITSRTEGLGTSVLDAFASGVPVVATNGGGLVEIVVDGETGLLADVGNPAALATQVRRLLTDKELAGKVTSAAKDRVKEFDKSRTARETFDAYLAAVEGR